MASVTVERVKNLGYNIYSASITGVDSIEFDSIYDMIITPKNERILKNMGAVGSTIFWRIPGLNPGYYILANPGAIYRYTVIDYPTRVIENYLQIVWSNKTLVVSHYDARNP